MRRLFLPILVALALILLLLAGCGGGGGNGTPAVTVTFTQPPPGDRTFSQGTQVALTVNASAPTGIEQVTFMAGGGVGQIGTANTFPWSVIWGTDGVAPNTYQVTATAYDNSNPQQSGSATITVSIEAANVNVTITSPQTGTVVQQGATVLITAEATVPAPQSINRVEFTANGENLGVDSTEPYSVNWVTTGVNPGVYTIVARAYDDSTPAQTGTGSILIEVEEPSEPAPTVIIDSPANGTPVSWNITVTATAQAQAPGATITNIQITLGHLTKTIAGGTVTVTGSVTFDTTQLQDGAYNLLAVTTDSNGRGASDSISINVNNGSAPPPPPW